MPLRDHFRPPLDEMAPWEALHGQWPALIVMELNRLLPSQFAAMPRVHVGSRVEIDVATFEGGRSRPSVIPENDGGGVATAVWTPTRPSLAEDTEWPDQDEYEILVRETRRGGRLVAAVEIVSPANKDRPEHRRAFVTKCEALLRSRVSVVIVDVVTDRHANLYEELLDLIGHTPAGEVGPLSATACRFTEGPQRLRLETWENPLAVGEPLPTLPLWLTDEFAVPLDLERTYEATCHALRIV